ncbi:MAG: hypothetical protein LH645_05295 [Actinomycetia bacterium]|nr:hypothetical protein [Actinomycetes bacterium]
MFDAGAVLVLAIVGGVCEVGLGLLVGGMIAHGQRHSPSQWESHLEGSTLSNRTVTER